LAQAISVTLPNPKFSNEAAVITTLDAWFGRFVRR